MTTAQFDKVDEPLRQALLERGFTSLTPVQEAVLKHERSDVDLRISSQTGSGKTVAMGLILAPQLERAPAGGGACRPRAIIIAPTRELATQVGTELTWLVKPLHARVISVTGGTSVRGEQKMLSRGAEVVVATPGRLLDHLTQDIIDPSQLHTVILDEADQMLDLGFRDELEGILEKLPVERRTHLVSATFPREVLALARRFQKNAVHIEGTTLGRAHADISHTVHVVPEKHVNDALVNLLLLNPDELTLVFVRMRTDAARVADSLAALGFSAAALTGEMEHAARTRVMGAFRTGHLRTLVATDVAARGIDVPEVSRIIQVDPPSDADIYTHRSGRTGRAGRKGTSIVLAVPQARARVMRVLKQAGVHYSLAPIPDAAAILRASDDRLIAELTSPLPRGEGAWEPHLHELAMKLLSEIEPLPLVHRLLARVEHHGPVPPRRIEPPEVRPAHVEETGTRKPKKEHRKPEAGWVTFRISAGSRYGLEPRRLLALVCRRGNIQGKDVGAIKIGTANSTFEIAGDVAERFANAAAEPDPREPKVLIEPLAGTGGREPPREAPRPAPREAPRPPPRAAPQREHSRSREHPKARRAPDGGSKSPRRHKH